MAVYLCISIYRDTHPNRLVCVGGVWVSTYKQKMTSYRYLDMCKKSKVNEKGYIFKCVYMGT